ncbi:MAG: chalcone isomerase family protein [Burkholderiaceae bacterium]
MTAIARRALACLLAAVLGLPAALANSPPPELQVHLPALTLSGQATLSFLGLDVYTARLWVAPGFRAQAYERHAFALELVYQRAFSSEDITRRSLDEMRRQPGAEPALLKTWEAALRAAIPDVRKGDRLIGVHRPGEGATFLANGKLTGALPDSAFARLFFGIWLAPESSELPMRAALLGPLAAR